MTATTSTLDHVLREVAANAAAIDAGTATPVAHLRALAAAGLLDQGIDDLLTGSPRSLDLRPSATTIASLAEECLSTAFGTWAHRVVEDYLARGRRTPATEATLARLRTADAVGSTGMAQALKALAGIGELGIEAVKDGDEYVLSGSVVWISNLVDDAILVLPARTADGGGIVVWTPYPAPGLTSRHVTGLLALDATASGSLTIDGLRIPADQVLTTDLASFVRAVKPTFLVLQTSFAAGLIRRSWAEIERSLDRAENAAFGADAAEVASVVEDFLGRWLLAASDVGAPSIVELIQLRLDACHLAQRVTRLELTLAGGRGYVATSAANRRFREAAFLPVQSPSEGHLKWELSSLA